MKRRPNQTLNENKKQKTYTINNEWICSKDLKDISMDDPFVYFLKYYKINSLKDKPDVNRISTKKVVDAHSTFQKKNAIDFEKSIIELIKKNHFITIIDNDITKLKHPLTFQQTFEYMKRGDNIIYKGVLHSSELKLYAVSDLLVRSDYLNKLVGYDCITKQESKIHSKTLDKNYYYIPINLKYSSITLSSNKINIRNEGKIKYYKVQQYITILILNSILDINTKKAFILSNRIKNFDNNLQSNNLQSNNLQIMKLGEINYDSYDKVIISSFKEYIKSIHSIRTNGSNWSLDSSIPNGNLQSSNLPKELYPNMKNNTSDINLSNIKKEFAEQIKEITLLPYCGLKERKIAHSLNIYKFDDPVLDAKSLLPNTEYNKNINNILIVNRNESKTNILPEKFMVDRDNWYLEDSKTLELFIDYETLKKETDDYIFLIGIVYKNNEDIIYKDFLLKSLDRKSELELIVSFEKYLIDIMTKLNKTKIKFYHWSSHEVNCNKIFEKNHNTIFCNNLNEKYPFTFYDLRKLFETNHAAIKGSYNYKLKSISKALYNLKLIDTTWENSSCSNGLDAMVLALELYNTNNLKDKIMDEIIHYNKIDCMVMFDILKLLRNSY